MRLRMKVTIMRRTGCVDVTLAHGQRTMLRCAAGYLLGAVVAAALGFAGVGTFGVGAVVFILTCSALLLAAGLMCSALGALDTGETSLNKRR